MTNEDCEMRIAGQLMAPSAWSALVWSGFLLSLLGVFVLPWGRVGFNAALALALALDTSLCEIKIYFSHNLQNSMNNMRIELNSI